MSHATSCGMLSLCGHGGWGLARSVTAMVVLGLALACPQQVQAETFSCGAEDVQCLIAAINAANATDQLGRERIGPCDIGAIAFPDEGDPRGESADDPPTDQDAPATAQTNMAGLIANLAEAVTTLKSATGGTAGIFNQIKLVIDRSADLARGGVSEGTSRAR